MDKEPEHLWPQPRGEVAVLMRVVAERLLESTAALVEGLVSASRRGTRYPALAEDPVLSESDRRMSRTLLVHWLTANMHNPGRRVPPCVDEATLSYARDLVRRGMGIDDLGSWRSAQWVAWRAWLDTCFEVTDDLADLRDLLDVSAASMITFVDDSIAALSDHIDAERQELVRGAQAERQATVQLLLEGAPISRARAEAKLGYALTGDHLAAVVWVDSLEATSSLEPAAERVMHVCGAARRLTLVASAAAQWLWVPSGGLPSVADLEQAVAELPGARVALGRPAPDLGGFRRSHLDAVTAQRVLARLGSARSVVRYQDVQLVAVLTADLAQAEHFVADTLGELASADPRVRATVLTYVEERFNASAAAERLFTHRSTVERRLARADALLPRPLADNATNIAAALMLVHLRDG
ncbi:PucR family transcriptional regulator [Streptomyces sp. NPDC056069]|uniref:PucR family transcriptional regulator n=1 Tax=Streptomyces sp. NPDC056069 TaxID=3345702 RepID=UPI0035D7ACC0